MRVLTTPNVKPGRVFVVEDGVLVVDGLLADLVRVAGDDEGTEVYLHPIDAPAFIARLKDGALGKRRLN